MHVLYVTVNAIHIFLSIIIISSVSHKHSNFIFFINISLGNQNFKWDFFLWILTSVIFLYISSRGNYGVTMIYAYVLIN